MLASPDRSGVYVSAELTLTRTLSLSFLNLSLCGCLTPTDGAQVCTSVWISKHTKHRAQGKEWPESVPFCGGHGLSGRVSERRRPSAVTATRSLYVQRCSCFVALAGAPQPHRSALILYHTTSQARHEGRTCTVGSNVPCRVGACCSRRKRSRAMAVRRVVGRRAGWASCAPTASHTIPRTRPVICRSPSDVFSKLVIMAMMATNTHTVRTYWRSLLCSALLLALLILHPLTKTRPWSVATRMHAYARLLWGDHSTHTK